MERLFKHIEYLLRQHDCVIVPTLGAFISERINARFDEESGVMFPPMYEICFNPSVKNNDGMIANSYVRKYSMTFADANQCVHDDVSELIKQLNKDGEIQLGRIGFISLLDDGLNFRPFLANIRSFNVFPSISLRREKHINKAKTIEENNKEELEQKSTRHFNLEKNYYIPVNKIFVKAVASLLVLVALSLSVILPPLTDQHQKKYETASIVPNTESITDAASILSQTQEPEIETESLQEDYNFKYYLIVATFQSLTQAEAYISSKRDSTPLTIQENNHIYRVSASGSDNKSELLDILNSSEFKENFGKGWIWTKK